MSHFVQRTDALCYLALFISSELADLTSGLVSYFSGDLSTNHMTRHRIRPCKNILVKSFDV